MACRRIPRAARQLARDWQALLDRMVRHDATLRARLLAAYENEPLLQAGTVFHAGGMALRVAGCSLDPHAT